MRDREWSLQYGTTSQTFGPSDLVVVNRSAPDLGDVEITSDDYDHPRADGRAFGLDTRSGRTITFDLAVVGQSAVIAGYGVGGYGEGSYGGGMSSAEAAARAALRSLAAAWRADSIRRTPGATASLFVRYAGVERVVFGRPRRWAPDDTYSPDGLIGVACDFACVDDLFYDAAQQSVSLGIVPHLGGGFVAPIVTPLSTTATSDRSVSIQVGGDVDTWPVATVYGPITNPVVEVLNLWKIELSTTLAAGQYVRIDTRPTGRSILRNGTASLAGSVTSASKPLRLASLTPGMHEVVLRGLDPTGTARMTFSWRDAYASL